MNHFFMDWWVVGIVDTNSSGVFTVIAHFALFSFPLHLKRKNVWAKSQGQVDYTA